MALRINVFLLLSKEVSPKSKTLVNFGSLCCNMDMSIFFIAFRRANLLRVVFGNNDFFFSVICHIGSGTSQINNSRKENCNQAPTHLESASLFLQFTISLQVFLDASTLYTRYIAFFSIDACAA